MKKIAIISNNCWGTELYNYLNMPYFSPLIGLYIHAPCFLEFISNLKENLQKDITFSSTSKYSTTLKAYPIGLLGGNIEIHFVHYSTHKEILEKWETRKNRMLNEVDDDRYFFKFCDRDHASPRLFDKFHSLDYKNKISFSVRHHGHNENIEIKNANERMVIDGKNLFYQSIHHFDLNDWLNGNGVNKKQISKV